MPEVMAIGIDISEFNGNVDIEALRGQIDFVIIRCGYGGNFVSQDDARFEENVRKCETAGIPYGVYLYSYAQNGAMARSEAAHALRLLRQGLPAGKRPLYGVWYDVEDRTLPVGEQLIDDCIIFCTLLEEAGYYCGIYANASWLTTRLNSPRLDRFDKWVAQWNNVLEYQGNYGMWQYTNNGYLNGRRFDMDRAYRDYPAIIREMEETDMTREEVAALARDEAQRVYEENERRYRTIDSVPGWAKEGVRQVYEELELLGTEEAGEDVRIDASPTYVRALYVISRLLDRMESPAAAAEEAPEA